MMGHILFLTDDGNCPFKLRKDDRVADGAAEALRILNDDEFEALVVCAGSYSIRLSSFIRRVSKKNPLMGIVLIGEDDVADRVTRSLIDLSLSADSEPAHIERQIERVIETRRVLAECDLVGKSPEIKAIGELIYRVAPTDLPVLIIGDSGTGKELVAKAIHRHSPRSRAPFLPINAAAIPAGTLESELFGHEKGSFTGAVGRHEGYFEQADHGTLFLDEVAELPMPVQAKLLRVLETGDVVRVGGRGTLHVDVRLIGATNADLISATSEKRFREDLYYRLAAVKINIPPLRQRPEDIPVLVYKFASEAAAKRAAPSGGISEAAVARMMDYHWPGNVRELRNLVENAILLAGEKPVAPEDIEGYFAEHALMGRPLPAIPLAKNREPENIESALAMIYSEIKNLEAKVDALADKIDSPDALDLDGSEKTAIIKALRDSNYDKNKAAKKLGISLRTLYRRLKKYDIIAGWSD